MPHLNVEAGLDVLAVKQGSAFSVSEPCLRGLQAEAVLDLALDIRLREARNSVKKLSQAWWSC